MINLFMDDIRVCPYAGWLTVRTIAEAKRYLASGEVMHMSLDHDMGACEDCIRAKTDVGNMSSPENQFMFWCKHTEDGTKLVHWMIETGNWSKFKPEVHSANPVGAARMRGMIDRYWPERHAKSS